MPLYENVSKGVVYLPATPARRNGVALCPRYWAPSTMPENGVVTLVMDEKEARPYVMRGQLAEVKPAVQAPPPADVVKAAEELLQTANIKAAQEAARAASSPSPAANISRPKRKRTYAIPE